MKRVLAISLAFVLCVFWLPTAHCADSGSSFEDGLASRRLIGGAVGDLRAGAQIPDPAEGTSVSEIAANLGKGGDQAARAVMWEEVIAGRKTEFMVTTAPGGQRLFQYWILRTGGGCDLYESAVFSNDGAPISAFYDSLRTVESGAGATGKVSMEAGPYDFIILDTWTDGFEKVDLASGTINTIKVVMRADADSALKTWPRVFRAMAVPLIPKDYFYFNAQPPHQLVKFNGTIGYPAPRLEAQLLRTWVAGPGKAPSAAAGMSLEDALAANGLIGGAMADPRAQLKLPQPAPGSVVDEIAMTLSSTSEPMAHYRIW